MSDLVTKELEFISTSLEWKAGVEKANFGGSVIGLRYSKEVIGKVCPAVMQAQLHFPGGFYAKNQSVQADVGQDAECDGPILRAVMGGIRESFMVTCLFVARQCHPNACMCV